MHCKSAKKACKRAKRVCNVQNVQNVQKTANKRKIHAKFTMHSECALSQLFHFTYPLTGAELKQKKGRESRERRIIHPVIREVGAEEETIIITRVTP